MAIIRITNLKLRTIIGTNDWERDHKQDVIINVAIHYDALKAARTDSIKDTLDYKTITKKIIKKVESSNFLLLEKLTNSILEIIVENPRAQEASVRIDKPFALRFADSVCVELTKKRNGQ